MGDGTTDTDGDLRAGPGEGSTGHWSVAHPRRWWYPACTSAELGRSPLAFTLMDLPLVAFRDGSGTARVVLDRCPHRNVPLSIGRVHRDGTLECGYHGWRFDGSGRCTAVPALDRTLGAGPSARDVAARPTREQDGVVWVWGCPDSEPDREPFRLPDLGPGRTGEVVFRRDIDCTVHASLENALDVPHTAFLHGGLFRTSERGLAVRAERTDLDDGVEVRYHGEPVAFGPVRLSRSTFEHWDRFFLPSIAQIEYRVGEAVQIVNTIVHLPLSATRTRAWFVLRFRSPLPAPLARLIVRARGASILRQDVEVLEAQTTNIERFGGERYTSTDLDLFGNAIWRLLRRAERAERLETERPEPDDSDDGAIEPTATAVTLRL